MKNEWKEIKFGDFVKIKRGHDLPKTKMNDGEYPVVGSNGIIGYHDKYTTTSPSLTIGRSGNIGKPYYLEKDTWSHNTTLYVEDFLGNDPYFVYNYLKIMKLNEFAGGSAVPTLNRNHINPVLINIPSIDIQMKISEILKKIDKKIEVNNKINNNIKKANITQTPI